MERNPIDVLKGELRYAECNIESAQSMIDDAKEWLEYYEKELKEYTQNKEEAIAHLEELKQSITMLEQKQREELK